MFVKERAGVCVGSRGHGPLTPATPSPSAEGDMQGRDRGQFMRRRWAGIGMARRKVTGRCEKHFSEAAHLIEST